MHKCKAERSFRAFLSIIQWKDLTNNFKSFLHLVKWGLTFKYLHLWIKCLPKTIRLFIIIIYKYSNFNWGLIQRMQRYIFKLYPTLKWKPKFMYKFTLKENMFYRFKVFLTKSTWIVFPIKSLTVHVRAQTKPWSPRNCLYTLNK